MNDSVVQEITDKFHKRSEAGIKKYGVTLDRTDLTPEQWILHLQEELMDAILYSQRVLREIKKGV